MGFQVPIGHIFLIKLVSFSIGAGRNVVGIGQIDLFNNIIITITILQSIFRDALRPGVVYRLGGSLVNLRGAALAQVVACDNIDIIVCAVGQVFQQQPGLGEGPTSLGIAGGGGILLGGVVHLIIGGVLVGFPGDA